MNVKVSEILLFLYLFLKNQPEIFYPDSFENWNNKCTKSTLIMIRMDSKMFRVSMSLDIARFIKLSHFSLFNYRSKALNIGIRVISEYSINTYNPELYQSFGFFFSLGRNQNILINLGCLKNIKEDCICSKVRFFLQYSDQ